MKSEEALTAQIESSFCSQNYFLKKAEKRFFLLRRREKKLATSGKKEKKDLAQNVSWK